MIIQIKYDSVKLIFMVISTKVPLVLKKKNKNTKKPETLPKDHSRNQDISTIQLKNLMESHFWGGVYLLLNRFYFIFQEFVSKNHLNKREITHACSL